MTIRATLNRHPVLAHFTVVFALSWGGVLLIIGGPGGIPGTPEETERLFPVVYLAMLVGPSVAGILLTGLVHGTAGLREFRSRLLTWRVGVRWYGVALLTAPLVVAAVLLALSLTSTGFLPGMITRDDKVSRLLFGLAVGLGAGFFEELGWTGFAVPALRSRYGVLGTGLIVGLVWGSWHCLVVSWGAGAAVAALPLSLFLAVDLFTFLVPFRVLMVWVYDRTGSLLIAMLMHASLTASMVILGPVALFGVRLLAYDLALGAALWIVVSIVLARKERHR